MTNEASDTYDDAVDCYRFWMNCIKFAGAEFTPPNIIRWARYAEECLADMIGFASA